MFQDLCAIGCKCLLNFQVIRHVSVSHEMATAVLLELLATVPNAFRLCCLGNCSLSAFDRCVMELVAQVLSRDIIHVSIQHEIQRTFTLAFANINLSFDLLDFRLIVDCSLSVSLRSAAAQQAVRVRSPRLESTSLRASATFSFCLTLFRGMASHNYGQFR